MESLKSVKKITEKIAPGRSPSFTEAHVIKAIEEIKTQEHVGRINLSKILGLSEGTTRTLIKHLTGDSLIEISSSGISLSRKGVKLFVNLRARMSKGVEIPSSSLTVGNFNVAVLVKNAGSFIRSGLEQRDVAIMTGAHGATTLVFSKDKLLMPGVNRDVFEDIPSIHAILLSEFKPKENDVIIVGSAENKRSAELGAKMAAFKLIINHLC